MSNGSKESRGTVFTVVLAAIALPLVLAAPHAQAKAPCDARYTVAGGVVTDNDTHLTWQQGVSSTGGSPCADGSNGCQTWSGAKTYCQGLALAGGGWRVPHVFELQTIVDEGRLAPAVDLNAFPGTPVDLYWASSKPGGAGDPWIVDLYAGSVARIGQAGADQTHRVRCVR